MSLLIEGMDMPKDHQQHDINLFNTADGFWAEEYRFKNSESKYKTRLLHSVVEIPTPHGDLIDRDLLLDVLDEIILKPNSYDQRCMAMTTKEILIRQTPVIKAEE